MPNLGNAYAAALQGPPAGGPPAPGPMPMGAAGAPPAAPQPAPMPRIAPDVNPMTQQGETFFLDPAMFEDDDCNVGDEVMLKATIQSKGSKIGLVPVEIVMEGESPDEQDEDSAGAAQEDGEASGGYQSPNIP